MLFLGVGTSAPLCQDAAYRFAAIGVLAEAPAAARAAREAGAATVAITSFADSPLTELADHVIVAGTRELALRLEAMASRLAHLALLEALLVAVAGRSEERSQTALQLCTDILGEHRL